MQKIGILTSGSVLPSVLRHLQKKGNFQPIGQDNSEISLPKEWENVDLEIADAEFALRALSRFAPKPGSFVEKIRGEKILASVKEREMAEDFDLKSVVRKCVNLSDRDSTREIEKIRLAELVGVFSVWQNFHLPLCASGKIGNIEVFLGSIERRDFDDFALQIDEMTLTTLQIVSEYPEYSYFFLMAHESVASRVHELLTAYRFAPAKFPEGVRTAAEELADLHDHEKKLAQESKSAEKEWEFLTKNSLSSLKLALDTLLWKREKRNAFLKSKQTQSTVFMEGWMIRDEIPTTETELMAVDKCIALWKIDTKEGESPPVLLKNHPMASPFEMVMRLFGLPSYDEIDPTPFFAPFFAFFVGLCLIDAGYGLLLSLIFGGALFLPLERGAREAIKLMLMCSIVAIFAGILFGGYFGMTHEQFSILRNPETKFFYGQIFEPLHYILVVMGFTYALGVFHLWIGVILSGANKWRKGNRAEALCRNGALALSIVLLSMMPFLQGGIREFFPFFFVVLGPALLWGFGHGKNPIARMAVGILGLFEEILSWLSNVLSYSRLFALGLAGSVIALVFNSIANIIGGMLPLPIAIPMWLLIIFFGHLLNIGLGLLGATIHSGRLQFVEFFGKFLDGNGKDFVPLARRGRYAFIPA